MFFASLMKRGAKFFQKGRDVLESKQEVTKGISLVIMIIATDKALFSFEKC